MTEKQKKFCEYYAESGNTVQSAIKAGYSKNYAIGRAHELFENVGIAQYISKLSQKMQNERILDATQRQEMLSDIARNAENPTSDRIKALDTLNKMTGEYVTKVQAEVKTSEKLADVFEQLGGEGLEE